MPKLKTNKGAAKRFRLTSKGRVKRKKAYKSHILTKKTPKRKRALRKTALINKRDEKNIRIDDLCINFTECKRRRNTASRY